MSEFAGSSAISKVSHVDTIGGIDDADWLTWFNDAIPSVYDPWHEWFGEMRFPRVGPLRSWLEYDIADVIERADRLRQTTSPATQTFTAQWVNFRRHHEALDECSKYRKKRLMVWRAAALKVICDRNCFQDVIDARQARDAYTATMRYFWSTPAAERLWTPNDPDDALGQYAGMVLLLMRLALKEKGA